MPQVPLSELLSDRPKPTWRQVARPWLRTERFWMEVTTRTISGVLSVLILGFLSLALALTTGLLEDKEAVRIIVAVTQVALLGASWFVFAVLTTYFIGPQTSRIKDPRLEFLAALGHGILILFFIFSSIYLFMELIKPNP